MCDWLKIHVKYFASYREKTGKKEEHLEGEFDTLDSLLQYLKKAYDIDTETLMVAVNRRIVASDAMLSESDEIALFPPVSGG
jgi:molybdopterin synthase sulfur carrier subunit